MGTKKEKTGKYQSSLFYRRYPLGINNSNLKILRHNFG